MLASAGDDLDKGLSVDWRSSSRLRKQPRADRDCVSCSGRFWMGSIIIISRSELFAGFRQMSARAAVTLAIEAQREQAQAP